MSQSEDEYFAREEAEKLRRLHQEKLKALDASDKEERKKLHWMHCPKCGYDLHTLQWRQVEIEKCFHCGVVVLDDGELERLAGKEEDGSFVRSLFSIWRHE